MNLSDMKLALEQEEKKGEDGDQDLILALRLQIEENEINQEEDQENNEMIESFLRCYLCGKKPSVSNAAEVPDCGHRFCKSCLHNYIIKIGLNNKEFSCPRPECGIKFRIDTWALNQKVLNKQEYDDNEKSQWNLMLTEGLVISCPNPKCGSVFAVEPSEIHNKITGEKDDNGNEMSLEAIQNRDRYRIRCIKCETTLCIKCKVSPYHLGKTCEEYYEYVHNPKCRYCHRQLLNNNNNNIDVCEDTECQTKLNIACTKILKCGHRCNSIKSSACLGCFNTDCKHQKINGDDYCTICFVEALIDAPCIQLSCSHVFHYLCLKKRIQSGYTTKRITFTHIQCPECRKYIDHPCLSSEIQKDILLLKKIKENAVRCLREENMLNDKALIDPKSKFYKKPEEYGLSKLAFYMCSKCREPYFAGLVECGENDTDKVLLCPKCIPPKYGIDCCEKHGKEFIKWKCRFCCNVANWYCWNSTHFCDACHTKQVGGDYLTKKKKSELPQCPGVDKCPLHIPHPPPGEEFSLGCFECELERVNLSL